MKNLQEAREALDVAKNKRRENTLPTAGRKPTFAAYSETYFEKATVQRKRPGTLQNERQSIGRWKTTPGRARAIFVRSSKLHDFGITFLFSLFHTELFCQAVRESSGQCVGDSLEECP